MHTQKWELGQKQRAGPKLKDLRHSIAPSDRTKHLIINPHSHPSNCIELIDMNLPLNRECVRCFQKRLGVCLH